MEKVLTKVKVAIVGGGAAGMGAAYVLSKAGLDVSIFEAEAQLGGHCFGVSVSIGGGQSIRVDAGVSDFNQATFVKVRALLEELGLESYPVNQDASFMTPDGAAIWFSRNGQPRFLQPLEDELRFLGEIKRFNKTCVEVLDDITYAEWSAGRYLDDKGFSQEFRRLYFDPRAQGCFPMPDRHPEQYMIRSLVAFWRMHGIVGPGPAERMVVRGGMHAYCGAFEQWLRDRTASLYLSTRVVGIARRGDGIRLRAVDREKANLTFRFDHVILATNANHVIPLFEDASQEEIKIYSGFGWQRARLVVHQDPQLMPRNRETWGAYNYIVASPDDPVQEDAARPETRPTITFYPNRLASLPETVPDVFVTMNPFVEPHAEKIITNQFFVHPAIDGITDMATQKLDAIQGRRGTWFCGSYLREPFVHEQAYRCGLELAERLVESVSKPSADAHALTVREASFDDFLLEIPLFSGLDTMALWEVQLVARVFNAEAGTMLFRQGDISDGIYLVKHGRIQITRRVPGDETVELAVLGRGSVIGEMGLLDRGRRSANAIAAEPTAGYFVSYERFQMMRSDFGTAAFAVMNRFTCEVAVRARRLIDEIENLLSVSRLTSAAANPGRTPRGEREMLPEQASLPRTPPIASKNSHHAPDSAATWPGGSSTSTVDIEILRQLPLFKNFSLLELREFIEPLKRYDFLRGQLLYTKGEPSRNCLIVVRGALSLNLSLNNGVNGVNGVERFSVHGPGTLVGALPLLDSGPHALICMARESTIAFEMDRAQFEILRKGGSVVAFKFFEAVTNSVVAQLRRANGHMARLAPEGRFSPEQTFFSPGSAAPSPQSSQGSEN